MPSSESNNSQSNSASHEPIPTSNIYISLQPALPITNNHSMTSLSKACVYKPKALLVDFLAIQMPSEPQTVQEAISDHEWKLSMKQEYDALMKNETWVLVPRSKDMHLNTNKYMYMTKFKAYGSIDKYKSRLVVREFQQTKGVDFFDTFSYMAKHSTIRVLFTIFSIWLENQASGCEQCDLKWSVT